MLGHYSAGFTLDTYAHVTTDAQLKAAQTMGNILWFRQDLCAKLFAGSG